MTTTGQNFTMWQGEDKTITVSLTNSSGSPYGDTDGLVFTWKVATSESATTALITKATGSGITNGTSQITIAIDEADTDDMAPGTYYHELRVVDTSSDHDVVLCGGLTLKDSITAT
jgi:hypothetical protein